MHTRKCFCVDCIQIRSKSFQEPVSKKRKVCENPTSLPPKTQENSTPREIPKAPHPPAVPTTLEIKDQNDFVVLTQSNNISKIMSLVSYIQNSLSAQTVNSRENAFNPQQIEVMKTAHKLIK